MAEKKTTFNRILYPKRMYCKDDFVRPDIFNGVTELGEAPEAIRTVRLLFFCLFFRVYLPQLKPRFLNMLKKNFFSCCRPKSSILWPERRQRTTCTSAWPCSKTSARAKEGHRVSRPESTKTSAAGC